MKGDINSVNSMTKVCVGGAHVLNRWRIYTAMEIIIPYSRKDFPVEKNDMHSKSLVVF